MTYYVACIYDDGCRDVKIFASSEDEAYEKLINYKGIESIILYPRLPKEDESIDHLKL